MNLSRMLAPKSAVFVGGSELLPIIENTKKNQFAGDIFIIGEAEKDFDGISSVQSIDDLPVDPDIAYVSLNQDLISDALRALQLKDCGGAVIKTTFDADENLQTFASAIEMPLLGINSPGFANFLEHSIFLQNESQCSSQLKSGVAIISNDEAYLSALGLLGDSLPVAYSIGIGNEFGLSAADLLDYVLSDDRVTAVNLFIDSVREVSKLSRAALKAARRGIPVVVVKAGRGIADNYLAVSSLFDRLGFIECSSTAEAIETLKVLVFTGRPLGRRLAIQAQSQAQATHISDVARRNCLDIKKLNPSIASFLRPLSSVDHRFGNPLILPTENCQNAQNLAEIYQPFFTDKFDLAVIIGSAVVENKQAFKDMLELFAGEAQRSKFALCLYQ